MLSEPTLRRARARNSIVSAETEATSNFFIFSISLKFNLAETNIKTERRKRRNIFYTGLKSIHKTNRVLNFSTVRPLSSSFNISSRIEYTDFRADTVFRTASPYSLSRSDPKHGGTSSRLQQDTLFSLLSALLYLHMV